ncbi:MAG TPA: type II secretion system protein [Gemmatimonadota bacterium]|nr:type II secretion system protein [Gemmatimonadota bacterium]
MDIPLPWIPAASSRRGVTLIEILLVMTLVGILAAIAIPRVAGSSDPYEAADEARRIHAAIADARARAVATQRQQRFILGSGGQWRVEEDVSGTWTVRGDSATARGSVSMNGASTGTITFYTRGRVDAAKTIRVSIDGHEKVIRVLASGLVRW